MLVGPSTPARRCSRSPGPVTAHAPRRHPRGWGRAANSVAFVLAAAAPAPAAAQVGLVASTYSDQRFRGYSLSDGRPVGIIDLSFDRAGGFYADASGIVVAARNE